MNNKIQNRQTKEKQSLTEQLKKTPIVQIACEKTGISRATFYRWHNEDPGFAQKADEALSEGSLLVNDMAESQLMSAIRDKNLTAIIFWLKHHHPGYTTRVEVLAKIKHDDEQLTPEQEALITRALKLAEMIPETSVINNQAKTT
jgi:hypothetical protein